MRKLVPIFTILFASKLILAQTFTVGSTCCNYHLVNKTYTLNPTCNCCPGTSFSYSIDIDGDLQKDLEIGAKHIAPCFNGGASSSNVYATSYGGTEIVYTSAFTGCPMTSIVQKLNYGAPLNASLNWSATPTSTVLFAPGPYLYYYNYTSQGTWTCGQKTVNHYIGFRKILPSNDTIYGWVNVDSNTPIKIVDYAYTCGSYTGTPVPSTITTLPGSICQGDSVLLNASPFGGLFYGLGVSGNYFKSKNLAAGVYTLNYAIPNLNGCSTLPSSLTLTVLPVSTSSVNITSSALPSCIGQPVVLTANGASTYTWSGGIISPTLQVNPTTTSIYTVTGLGSASCSLPFILTFTQTINQPTISASVVNASVCPGASTQLSAGSASSYTWSTGANTQTCVVSPSVNTIYTVAATYSPGCVVTNTVMQSVAAPTVTLAGPTSTICAGKYITLMANGASTYSWSTGANGNQVIDLPLVTTNYSVVGFGIGGCNDTANIQVTINNNNLILTAISNQSIICPGDTAVLSLSGSSTYIIDGSPFEYYTVNQQTVAIVPQVTTTYVIYGDSLIDGCVSSGVITQSVASCVAVEELNLVGNDFKIYPNPAASKLFVEMENELSSEIELNLMNVDGRKVKSLRLTNKEQEIDLSEISSGIYIVEIVMEKHVLKKKIIITP